MSPLYFVLFATLLARVAYTSELSRVKRQVPGGVVLQDPNDPKYKELAQESFEKYRVTNPGGQIDVKDLKVTRVTRQVVAGYKTIIDFTVTPTNGEVITCHSVIVEQAWLKKKDIDVDCNINQPNSSIDGDLEEKDPDDEQQTCDLDDQCLATNGMRLEITAGHKLYRDTTLAKNGIKKQSRMNLPGGQAEKDPNDPKYMQLAQESFTKYCETNPGGPIDVKEIKVTKVTHQVVAGSMTRITFTVEPANGDIFTCYAKIWEQPWLNKKEIEVKCEPDDYKLVYVLTAHSLGLGAGAQWLRYYSFIDIFAMTPVHCTLLALLVIIVLASVDAHLFASSAISRVKRQIAGTPEIQDPMSPKYKKLGQESFEKYRQTHSAGQIIVKDIIVTNATRQMVAGDRYRLTFNVFPNYGDELNCYSEVYEKFDHQKEFTVNCENVTTQSRMKRDNLLRRKNPWALYPWRTGMFRNPNDTVYMKLAEESFAKYLTIHPESQSLATDMNRIIVTKAHYLPGGPKRIIDFVVFFNTAYPKKCHSEVLEHHRANTKDITLNCNDLLTIVYPSECGRREETYLVDISILIMTPVYFVLVVTFVTVLVSIDAHSFVREASSAITQHSRMKRQLVGAPEIQDPTKPEYKKLAQESFEKYRATHSAGQIIVKDIIVTKATRQLVSGYMHRLTFIVFPNYGNELKCYSEVYEEFQNKKFTVTSVYCDNV
ncbi:uncharacterized protein LOC133528504 [Cydia pomonella]|uniref:uncharacterized protein LOC133528504 n=1 Tax=Cydia pomonella TaxID=82600 RepID=UPI002ADDA862|nr:uncharacterized protein LOC133528504 [Cydia pomonella]